MRRNRLFIAWAAICCVCWCGRAGVLRETFVGAEDCPPVRLVSGARMELPSFGGSRISLRLGDRSVSVTGHASFTAAVEGGRVPETAVVVGTADGFFAKVQDLKTGNVLTFARDARGVRVREERPLRRRSPEVPRPRLQSRLPIAKGTSARVLTSGTTFAAAKARWLARGESETNVVDVLVAYDTTAAAWVRENCGEDGIDVFAEESVAKMNLVLRNSGLDDYRFRLVGTKTVDFNAQTVRIFNGGESIVDYSRLLDNLATGSGSVWKDLRAEREATSADIVVFLVDNGEDAESGMVGLGYALDADNIEAYDLFADHAYDVCSVRNVATDHTMTHEVGHNLGAGHGDKTQMNPFFWDVGPQLFGYSSAHYFSVGEDEDQVRYYTVMGYNWDGFPETLDEPFCVEAPYFSTPAKTFAWLEVEDDVVTTNDTGVAVGTALHDNVRTLRETFAIAANYRPHRDRLIVDVGPGGGTVTGGGAYVAGASVKLVAKALPGYVFAGWYAAYDEETTAYSLPLEGTVDYRTTTFSIVMPGESATVYARFVPVEEDRSLSVVCAPNEEGYVAGEAVEPIPVSVPSASLPTVSVKNLPTGLGFDAKKLEVTGTPTKPGVYDAVFTAKNVSTATTNAVVRFKIANFTDPLITKGEDLPEGLEDSYGSFIPGVPVDLPLPCAMGWTVKGLPGGLKFDKTTSRVTGTPTKPGASTVYFTSSVKDKVTGKAVLHTATATFVVDALRNLTLVTDGTGTGQAKGAGVYAANRKVSLKAVADTKANAQTKAVKSVFMGWYDGETLLSKSAGYSYIVNEEPEQTLTARFVTAEEDAASVALAVRGEGLSVEEAVSWTNMCGLAVEWEVAATALSETTVKAAGLPSGLKLVQDKTTKAYVVTGTPQSASKLTKDKTAYVPSVVTFTVTTAGKAARSYQVLMTILPLEAWAQGTFAGFAADVVDEGLSTNGVGVASMTVSASGKISGKYALYGTNWTFSASGYSSFEDAEETTNRVLWIDAAAKAGKMTKKLEICVTPGWMTEEGNFVNCSGADGTDFGNLVLTLRRDVWKDKLLTAAFPPSVMSVEGFTGLKVKVASSGKATFSGLLDDGMKASGSFCVFFDRQGCFWTWLVVPYSKIYSGFVDRIEIPVAE